MEFIDEVKERARRSRKTVVLPETEDIRTLEAASQILKEEVADLVLIGNKEEILKKAENLDLSGAVFMDPMKSEQLESYIELLVELRKSKGMTRESADIIVETIPDSSSLSVNINSVMEMVSFSLTMGMTPAASITSMQFFWLRHCSAVERLSLVVSTWPHTMPWSRNRL